MPVQNTDVILPTLNGVFSLDNLPADAMHANEVPMTNTFLKLFLVLCLLVLQH